MSRLHLRVFVLLCVLVGGAVAPFAAPAAAQAGANNSSNSTDDADTSRFGEADTSSLRPAQTNVTRNTTAENASQVDTNATLGSLSPGFKKWVRSVAKMNSSRAQQAAENNPQNASKLADVLRAGGVSNPSQQVENSPKEAARGALGIIAMGGGIGDIGIDPIGAAEGAWNKATPDVPSTQKIANDTATWAKKNTLNATQWALKKSLALVVGTTHPVNGGPNGVFGTPTNKPYQNLYNTVYGPFSFQYSVLILLVLLFAMIAVMPYAGLASGGTYRVTQTAARILGALLLIMFWWPIGTMLTQFFDALALSIAPSAQELTSSMEGMFKLSAGPILAALAFYVVGFSEVLALGFIYAFRQAALIVFQFAMPLLLVFAYAGPHRRVRSIASTISWQYFSLLVMTVPAAFLMRIGFEAEWGFGLGIIGNLIVSMSLLALALAVPIVFSIAAFRAPPSINSLASGAAGAAAGAASTARERLPSRGGDEDGEAVKGTGYTETTQYVESTPVGDRVAATDGGTNYTNATARGPGEAPGGALPGDTGVTAERVRDFEKQTRGQDGGSATAKTKYHDESDIIDVEGGVINEGDRS